MKSSLGASAESRQRDGLTGEQRSEETGMDVRVSDGICPGEIARIGF